MAIGAIYLENFQDSQIIHHNEAAIMHVIISRNYMMM